MDFKLLFNPEAESQLGEILNNKSDIGRAKQVKKALHLIETNLKQPSLQVHIFESKKDPNGEKYVRLTPKIKHLVLTVFSFTLAQMKQ